jgi:hypothetical protein
LTTSKAFSNRSSSSAAAAVQGCRLIEAFDKRALTSFEPEVAGVAKP